MPDTLILVDDTGRPDVQAMAVNRLQSEPSLVPSGQGPAFLTGYQAGWEKALAFAVELERRLETEETA